MILTGKPGFGKSHLANVVIDHLLERYPRGSSGGERASLAYYYMQNAPDESLTKCLGAIVYQFAKSDRAYAKAVAAVCSRPEGLGSPDELGRRLVMELQDLMQGTYFVVIDGLRPDGVDERVKDALLALIETANSTTGARSIRLFFSAQDSELPAMIFAQPGIAHVPLGLPKGHARPGIARTRSRPNEVPDDHVLDGKRSLWNEDDVVAFARARLATMCDRRPYLASTLLEPDLDAAMTLARGVKGNYSSLQLKLDQIEASDNAKEILTVVKEASQDPIELLSRDVDSLNDALDSEEIHELNDLLLWVSGVFEPCTRTFLQAALGDKTLWLEKHIPQKFYQLLRWDVISDVVETPRPAETVKLLQRTSDVADDNIRSAHPGPVADLALQENEIELVQRVVRTFCGDQLFEKFGFHSFFQSKAVKRNVRIEIPDTCTMHTRILRRCLESLCKDQDDSYFAPLRTYAAANFMRHLECIDLNVADRTDLRAIGRLLLTMLSEERAVHAWFSPDNWEVIGPRWVLDVEYVEAITRCLRHPLVEAGYRDDERQKQRPKDCLKDATKGVEILQCVAEYLAKRWFERARAPAFYFQWPFCIMTRIWGRPVSESGNPTVDELNRYFAWARGLSMIDVRPSHWSLRIAAALSLCQHHQQALDRCLEVEVEGPKDWPVLLKTGEIHLKLKNYTEALTCFHKVKAFRPELMEKDPDFVSDYWSSVPLHEGRIHRELGDLDAAEACFQEIIKNCPPDEGPGAREAAIVNLFKLWDDRKAYIHVVNLVKQWAGVADGPESAASWLIRLARDDDFHRCLVSVTARQFEHADIIRSYEKALSIGDTNKQAADLASLQAWHALLLFHSSSDDQRARAFDLWQDVVESSGEDSQSFWHAYHTSRTLCKHLLDDAIAHSVAPPSSVATRHAERLAKLSQLNLPVIREAHKDNDDPRLALARLQTMAGESTEARATVRDRLRSLFDSWPESSEHRELINRHCRLAQTFTVLGDDENAIAAWQLLQPERPEAEGDKDDRENGSPYVDTSDTVAGASRNGKVDWQHDDVANGEPSAHETKAGADVDDPGSAETHGNPAGTPDGASSHPENLEDLTSLLTFGCDGCGFGWKAFGDIHVCRHCMDAQFCAACHAKLRAGLLHVTICNKDHEHLYIPPFDRKQWEAMNPETMLVGGEVVSRKAWLDRLREQWGLGQSSIDELKSRMATQAQAAKVLTRWRRALLKVRAATR